MTTTCTACTRDREFIDPETGRAPTHLQVGDFWLCPSCGEIHRFTDRIAIDTRGQIRWIEARPATAEELAELGQPYRSELLNKRASIRGLA